MRRRTRRLDTALAVSVECWPAPPAGERLTVAKSDYDAFERLLGDIQAAYSAEDLSTVRARPRPRCCSISLSSWLLTSAAPTNGIRCPQSTGFTVRLQMECLSAITGIRTDMARTASTASRLLRFSNLDERIETENLAVLALARKRQLVS
jgi:hypothetical protein